MKWPASVTVIRHAQSVFNALRQRKDNDPEYRLFKSAFSRNHRSEETQLLAAQMRLKYALGVSDFGTPLTKEGEQQAYRTGSNLKGIVPLPDIIFCSPYRRTKDTLSFLSEGWPALSAVECVAEDRIREQEHGLSLLYSDWRIFQTLHPEQKEMHDLLGPYWYQYPQGESASQVRDRTRQVLTMLVRECSGMHVMLVTHHLTILSLRANLERLTPSEFVRLDKYEKPVNCGVTHYLGDEKLGKDGRLVLEHYNRKLYSSS